MFRFPANWGNRNVRLSVEPVNDALLSENGPEREAAGDRPQAQIGAAGSSQRPGGLGRVLTGRSLGASCSANRGFKM